MEILKFFGIMAVAAIVWICFSELLNLGFIGIALALTIVGLSFYYKWFDVRKM